jgi:hypothetical protein
VAPHAEHMALPYGTRLEHFGHSFHFFAFGVPRVKRTATTTHKRSTPTKTGQLRSSMKPSFALQSAELATFIPDGWAFLAAVVVLGVL